MSEFDTEPVPGLPEELPQGETLLWQGSPNWTLLARQALHATAASVYVGAIAVWALVSALQEGESTLAATQAASRVALAGALGIALLGLIAWLIARTTIYSITNKRIVMRFGVALPMAFNIPYSQITTADAKLRSDGSGDVSIRTKGTRLGFTPLWPHVRAWRLRNPEPVLRCIPDAGRVAQILAQALAAANGTVPKQVAAPAAVRDQRSGLRGATPAAA